MKQAASTSAPIWRSEDQPVELIEATGGDPSTGAMLVVADDLHPMASRINGFTDQWLGGLNNQVQHLFGRVLRWEPTTSI
jgi:hypothetical protein